MDDDQIEQGDRNALRDYHMLTDSKYYGSAGEKRRDRLEHSSCNDEPAAPELLPYLKNRAECPCLQAWG